jgi:ADP-ribosylation factor-like protein 6
VVAKDELDTLLGHPQLGQRVPLLFLANKCDLPSALPAVELAQVRRRVWPVLVVVAVAEWQWQRASDAAAAESRALTQAHRLVLTQALRLEELRDRPWQIVATNGLTGEGLDKAMDWMAEKLLR